VKHEPQIIALQVFQNFAFLPLDAFAVSVRRIHGQFQVIKSQFGNSLHLIENGTQRRIRGSIEHTLQHLLSVPTYYPMSSGSVDDYQFHLQPKM
jgi:hypothetical protein